MATIVRSYYTNTNSLIVTCVNSYTHFSETLFLERSAWACTRTVQTYSIHTTAHYASKGHCPDFARLPHPRSKMKQLVYIGIVSANERLSLYGHLTFLRTNRSLKPVLRRVWICNPEGCFRPTGQRNNAPDPYSTANVFT